jgi:hypothetical protein
MAEATPQAGKSTRQRGLGWTLFVGFIAITVLLIVMIWADNLTGGEIATPGYYRDTFIVDESVYATVTAEAAAGQAVTPTPPTE